jgi:hypothetical protein
VLRKVRKKKKKKQKKKQHHKKINKTVTSRELDALNEIFMQCLSSNKDTLTLDWENFLKFLYTVFPGKGNANEQNCTNKTNKINNKINKKNAQPNQ